jgi:hypothetical protein
MHDTEIEMLEQIVYVDPCRANRVYFLFSSFCSAHENLNWTPTPLSINFVLHVEQSKRCASVAPLAKLALVCSFHVPCCEGLTAPCIGTNELPS